MRKSPSKHFTNIEVDESNILQWKGLVVPVRDQLGRGGARCMVTLFVIMYTIHALVYIICLC